MGSRMSFGEGWILFIQTVYLYATQENDLSGHAPFNTLIRKMTIILFASMSLKDAFMIEIL